MKTLSRLFLGLLLLGLARCSALADEPNQFNISVTDIPTSEYFQVDNETGHAYLNFDALRSLDTAIRHLLILHYFAEGRGSTAPHSWPFMSAETGRLIIYDAEPVAKTNDFVALTGIGGGAGAVLLSTEPLKLREIPAVEFGWKAYAAIIDEGVLFIAWHVPGGVLVRSYVAEGESIRQLDEKKLATSDGIIRAVRLTRSGNAIIIYVFTRSSHGLMCDYFRTMKGTGIGHMNQETTNLGDVTLMDTNVAPDGRLGAVLVGSDAPTLYLTTFLDSKALERVPISRPAGTTDNQVPTAASPIFVSDYWYTIASYISQNNDGFILDICNVSTYSRPILSLGFVLMDDFTVLRTGDTLLVGRTILDQNHRYGVETISITPSRYR